MNIDKFIELYFKDAPEYQKKFWKITHDQFFNMRKKVTFPLTPRTGKRLYVQSFGRQTRNTYYGKTATILIDGREIKPGPEYKKRILGEFTATLYINKKHKNTLTLKEFLKWKKR